MLLAYNLFFSMGIYLLLSVLFEVISKQEIYAYGKIDRSDAMFNCIKYDYLRCKIFLTQT